MQDTSDQSLPELCFLTYEAVLGHLTSQYAKEFLAFNHCTFMGYVNSRTSHKALPAESQLIENEIGGVIMGSLETVLQLTPLSEEQYLSTKRSNIDNKTSVGIERRLAVYRVFKDYAIWKHQNDLRDNNDRILRLLKWLALELEMDSEFELFSSGMFTLFR